MVNNWCLYFKRKSCEMLTNLFLFSLSQSISSLSPTWISFWSNYLLLWRPISNHWPTLDRKFSQNIPPRPSHFLSWNFIRLVFLAVDVEDALWPPCAVSTLIFFCPCKHAHRKLHPLPLLPNRTLCTNKYRGAKNCKDIIKINKK